MSENEKHNAGDFGIIGLAVMGANLALNIEEHGFTVAVWNRRTERMQRFISDHAGKRFIPAKTLEELVAALERPRKIMIMIKAGEPIDIMVENLMPLLDKGDILLDGGNSWFKDTQRRAAALEQEAIHYFGVGVSGGEEGARSGPSLMPGGPAEAYGQITTVLESIAAKTESGACVGYIGPDGAGHFVKMVHNGIEYGSMQLIAEAYDILRRAAGLEPPELSDVFTEWNRGPLESFLIELTARIFRVRDAETGRPLVDLVLDKAGQKGTGAWTVQAALELGVPIPTIAAAVDARILSGMKEERIEASGRIKGPAGRRQDVGKEHLIATVRDALCAARICCYAQGMSLLRAASNEHQWNMDLKEIARIWKGGCIIRARLLDSIMGAFDRKPGLPNLLLDDTLGPEAAAGQDALRDALNVAQGRGIPAPAMGASLAYFDSYRTADLPQNLTQAQRDAFGAHTYERTDKPGGGPVHTDWREPATARSEIPRKQE